MRPLPSIEKLREFLDPDYRRGILIWRALPGRCSTARVGESAGKADPHKQNRVIVGIAGNRYFRYRILYALYHGIDPFPLVIDHRDGDPTNDRIDNLRATTQAGNLQNQVFRSGALPLGVHLYRRAGKKKYHARIQINGKCKSLGYYLTPEEAHAAYIAAAKALGRGRMHVVSTC